MNRHFLTFAPLAAVVALAMAAPSDAATAYMDGVLNIGPGWHTMTLPDGSRCGVDCREITYDYVTPESAKRAALAWMTANNDADAVLNAYSLGALGAADARAALPEWKGTLNLVGTSVKPGNGASYAAGGREPLDVAGGKVTIVSTKGDSVAYRDGSLSTHMNGYRGRDFSAETPVKVSTPTDAVADIEYGATPRKTWAEKAADAREERSIKAEQRRIDRTERAEARRVAREERRAASKQRWADFFDSLKPASAATDDESTQADDDTENEASE
jgi:hypothetical protein